MIVSGSARQGEQGVRIGSPISRWRAWSGRASQATCPVPLHPPVLCCTLPSSLVPVLSRLRLWPWLGSSKRWADLDDGLEKALLLGDVWRDPLQALVEGKDELARVWFDVVNGRQCLQRPGLLLGVALVRGNAYTMKERSVGFH